MFLARVQGRIVASQKDAAINGTKLMIVEPLRVDYPEAGGGTFAPTGRAIVAVDRIGAGEGELVLIVQGSSSRMVEGCSSMPIDAAIVGLVNEASVRGETIDLSNVPS
ncbi:MAG: EutN/CcmL family microcompartment protein [Phycisphaeraceae bacterium]